jgi:hypothetical protein
MKLKDVPQATKAEARVAQSAGIALPARTPAISLNICLRGIPLPAMREISSNSSAILGLLSSG